MADIPYKSSGGSGGSLRVGDYVTTENTTTEAGSTLLTLDKYKNKILTPAQETLYPELAAILPEGLVFEHYPIVGITSLNPNTSTYRSACTSDGKVVYMAVSTTLSKFDSSTGLQTTINSGVSGYIIYDVACSADGNIIAFVSVNSAGNNARLYVSTDGGGVFSAVKSLSGTIGNNSRADVDVLPDGSQVKACLWEQYSATFVKIDDPSTSLTPSLDVSFAGNLTHPYNGGVGSASFVDGDGGLFFAVSYQDTSGHSRYEYTEDGGSTFTELSGFPASVRQSVLSGVNSKILVDSSNKNKMLLHIGGSNGVASVYFSIDKGVSWEHIPSPSVKSIADPASSSFYPSGWGSLIRYKPVFKFGYIWLLTATHEYVLYKIDEKGGTFLEKLDFGSSSTDKLAIGWSVDGNSAGLGGLHSANEYTVYGGLLRRGKLLSASGSDVTTKIVANNP